MHFGAWRAFVPIPAFAWRRALAFTAKQTAAKVAFMTAEDRLVRDFVVTELARTMRPIPPADIAAGTGVAHARVLPILEELERRLVFLVRDARGDVEWAYPVTTAATPHHLHFSTGERLDAA